MYVQCGRFSCAVGMWYVWVRVRDKGSDWLGARESGHMPRGFLAQVTARET